MRPAMSFAAALSVAASLVIFPRTAAAGDAPVLKVEAISPKGAGTMHYADELRLSVGDSAILTLKTNVAAGKLIPNPGPQYPIDDSHVLLLGWSSYGGGMLTLHGMLVGIENDEVKLQRELALTAGRTLASLIVRRNASNEILLGIGAPLNRMFNEHDWSLVLGPAAADRLDIGQIRKLPFVAEEKRADDVVYAPPFGGDRFPARIAWFSASASGFAPWTGGR